MNNINKILIILIVGLIACHSGIRLTKIYIGGWSEKQIGFVNSIPQIDKKGSYFDIMMECKWFGIGLQDFYISNSKPFNWIRNPENILVTHNTLMGIGYKNFIPDTLFYKPMRFQDNFGGMRRHDWEDLSISQVLDSLIISYNKSSSDSGYFGKFWERRKQDRTDKVLIEVFREIKYLYDSPEKLIYGKPTEISKLRPQKSNDTLEMLLRFDLKLQDFDSIPNPDFLWDYFNYLREIGLNQSAYNLVIEKYPNQIKLDTVISIMELDTITETDYWETRNNGTWIFTYSDNGP